MGTANITDQLNQAMKNAMKEKDKNTLRTVRMVKAAMQEKLNQPDGPNEATDDLWQQIIAAYLKKMSKAAQEYRNIGERGADKLAEIEFEISYLKPYLPAQVEGDELKQIAKQAIEKIGATSPKDTGRVMGAIMKEYAGRVDSKSVKDLVGQLLSAES